ncbi:MAG: putative transrane protein [Myxococcaceae bacterium]|nr:putative transrane protein [Myxococcaceae bacterium]
MFEEDTEARPIRRARGARGPKKPAFAEESLATLQRPIHDAVRPCLVELAYLGARERRTPPDVAYEHARKLLHTTKAKLEALSLPVDDVRDIHYALAAFGDEAMQQHPGPLKDFWQSHLLQLELYGETRAGEGFFERLERAKTDRRLGVLRVYHLCLLFGFHGIYGQHGELERENLLDEVRQALGDHGNGLSHVRLSPHGERPDEPGMDQVRNRLLLWLASGTALAAAAWYVGISFTLDAQERTLNESVRRAYEDLKVGLAAGGE